MTNYSRVRDTIKSGDVLAWKGTGLVGWLIRMWTGEAISHVGVAIKIKGRVMVFEAREGSGVQMRPVSSALPCRLVRTGAKWNPIKMDAIIWGRIGKPYSYLDALRAGLSKPTRHKGWQCAEMAVDLMITCGVLTEDQRDYNTPGKLIEALLKEGATVEHLSKG